jgi:myo-inositol 2-dehydrogenase / D-chiro-inositol 1-dehydrogenase
MVTVNRRAFLASSAVAAGAAWSGAALAQEPRVKTGVIGVGGRGTGVLRGVLEHGTVAAVCDTNAERLAAAATLAQRDSPASHADYRRVLDMKDVEAVVIATPPYLHAEMAIAALQAGKHVFCEKPVAITPETVHAVVKAVQGSDRVFVVGQQLRSYRRLGQAVGKIHGGTIGDVLMVKAQRHMDRDLSHTGTSAEWFFDVDKSGGYLIEMSVHNLDLCNWAVGEVPSKAAGFGGILFYKDDPPGRSIMDGYTVNYDYPSGVKLYFTQMVFHPRGLPGGGQFVHVYGQKGAVDLMGDTSVYPLEGDAPPFELAPKQEEPPHEHVRAFFDTIRTGAPNPADIIVGATGALTAIMGHQAIINSKVVEWKDVAGPLAS